MSLNSPASAPACRDVSHHAQFMEYWGSNPELCICRQAPYHLSYIPSPRNGSSHKISGSVEPLGVGKSLGSLSKAHISLPASSLPYFLQSCLLSVTVITENLRNW